MQWLNRFVEQNTGSAIAIGVIVFFIGFTIAAKADSKWGYVIAAVGAALALYALKGLGVW